MLRFLAKAFYRAERYLGIVGGERLDTKREQLFVRLWVFAFGGKCLKDNILKLQLLANLFQEGAAWHEWFFTVEIADLDVDLKMRDPVKVGLAQVVELFGELFFRAAVPKKRQRFRDEFF